MNNMGVGIMLSIDELLEKTDTTLDRAKAVNAKLEKRQTAKKEAAAAAEAEKWGTKPEYTDAEIKRYNDFLDGKYDPTVKRKAPVSGRLPKAAQFLRGGLFKSAPKPEPKIKTDRRFAIDESECQPLIPKS
jgi:hypothetical protein